MKQKCLVFITLTLSLFCILTAEGVSVSSPGSESLLYSMDYYSDEIHPLHLDVSATADTGTCHASALAMWVGEQVGWSLSSTNEGTKTATHSFTPIDGDLMFIEASVSVSSDCSGYSGFANVYIMPY